MDHKSRFQKARIESWTTNSANFQRFKESNKSNESLQYYRPGVPNLGDARGSQVVVFVVQLYQWGDVIDVWGDREAKRLETPTTIDASNPNRSWAVSVTNPNDSGFADSQIWIHKSNP